MTQNDPVAPAAPPLAPAWPGTAPEAPGATPEGPGTTGHPQVDAALDKLADLAELPLNEHPAVFEQIHGALTGALGTLDSGPLDSGTGSRGTGDPAAGGRGS